MNMTEDSRVLRYVNDKHDLTDANFLLYAAKHYDNTSCHDMDEFHTDLIIPMHLKKLFTRYHVNNDLKERLILNHVICFYNVFEPVAACKILFFKMEEKYYSYLKTVLVYLDRCPECILINGKLINLTEIPLDEKLYDKLRKEK